MDTRFSEEDEAFRREVAEWLDENLQGEFAVVRGRGGPGDEHALLEERHAWEKKMGADGWTCVGWPVECGGRGSGLSPAGDLLRGVRPGEGSGPGRPHRRGSHRPHDHPLRHRGAEAALPARHRERRRDLVPGLLGAERGLRSGQRPDPGRARRRRMGDQRSEGLDLRRRLVRLVLRRLPHRSGRPAEAPRASPTSSFRWIRRASRSAPSSR